MSFDLSWRTFVSGKWGNSLKYNSYSTNYLYFIPIKFSTTLLKILETILKLIECWTENLYRQSWNNFLKQSVKWSQNNEVWPGNNKLMLTNNEFDYQYKQSHTRSPGTKLSEKKTSIGRKSELRQCWSANPATSSLAWSRNAGEMVQEAWEEDDDHGGGRNSGGFRLGFLDINREILVRPVYKAAYASMSSCSPLIIGLRCCCCDNDSSSPPFV